MRRKNDILLKSAFEETFPDLLRFFFEDADRIFDVGRGFEFMDKELLELFPELERNGGTRVADMLVKAYSKAGSEKWLLIHIEIQQQNDDSFGRRMFQYFYRIFDRYQVQVTALAVFTGGRAQKCCSEYEYDFLGTALTYRFNSFRIFDIDESELYRMDNPFALIIIAAQKASQSERISDPQMAQYRLDIAKALISCKKYDLPRIRRIMFFLKAFLRVENSEINSIFDNTIKTLTENHTAMGIIETINMLTLEEGMEKGIERSKRVFVANLLSGTDLSVSRIAGLAEVSEEFVEDQIRLLGLSNR